MAAFSEDFHSGGDDFKALLAIFCSYDDGASASEAVEKIATEKKDYHKWSLCSIVCWIAINNNKKDWLLRRLQCS